MTGIAQSERAGSRHLGNQKADGRAALRTDQEFGFGIGEIIATAVRQWRMIVSVMVLAAGIAAVYAWSLPNVYDATVAIEIDKRDSKILNSEAEVLASADIARRVIEKLGLHHDPEFSNESLLAGLAQSKVTDPMTMPAEGTKTQHAGSGNTSAFSKPDNDGVRARNSIVQNFLGLLSVHPIHDSRVIEVTFTSREPDKAARIANTIVDVYIERQIEAQVANLNEQGKPAKSNNAKLLDLEREVKPTQDLSEVLLSGRRRAEETLGIDAPDIRIVAHADVPVSASRPDLSMILLIATAAGFFFAVGLALLLDQITGGTINPYRIKQEFHLPRLATLPCLRLGRNALHPSLDAVRLMLSQPNSLYAESIREIQHELDWRHHHKGARIILVTSSVSGEGKSLIASNLAHNLAMMGRGTLLIDADMRKQSLTRLLEASGHNGFYEVLCKGLPVDGAVLRDDTTGLSFMPAASIHTTGAPPVQILDSRRTQALLGRLKSHYEVVVIDAPALLPFADARILARHADQILFTINGAVTPKRLVHRALRALERNSRKVAGIVLNSSNPAAHDANISGKTTGPARHRQPPPLPTAA